MAKSDEELGKVAKSGYKWIKVDKSGRKVVESGEKV